MAGGRVSWTESLAVGLLVFGLVGTSGTLGALAALVAYLRTDGNLLTDLDPAVVASAAVAASVTGVLVWRYVLREKGASTGKGAAAGLYVGIIVHPVCWLFYGVYGLSRGGFGAADFGAAVFIVAVVTTIASLGVAGWITVPLGALLGYLVQGFRPAAREGSSP